MPSGQDEEIAVIFREMRRASEMAPEQLSERLKTPLATIEALEAGDIAALPDWHETSRIITAYAGFLGLDSRPILRRLKAHRAAADAAASPQGGDGGTPEAFAPPQPQAAPAAAPEEPPVAAGPPMPPGAARAGAPAPPDPRRAAAARPSVSPAPAGAGAEAGPSPPSPGETQAAPARRPPRRPSSRPVTWLLLLLILAAMGWGVHYAVGHPQRVWSGVDLLPDPGPRLVRSLWTLLRPVGTSGVDPGGTITAGGKADKATVGRRPEDE